MGVSSKTDIGRVVALVGWTALLAAVAFIFGLPFAYALWALR